MQFLGDTIQLSATDLVGHLNCRHLTQLDHAVAKGALLRPEVWDPLLEVLWERGARHEQGYCDHLEAAGLTISKIDGVGVDDAAVAQTLAAMRAGVPIIVQGALRAGRWCGRADVLKRIEVPSQLGQWSYEAVDTKLARETKAGAVLQLCLYSELLAETQGIAPAYAYVVAPWTDYAPQPFRVNDFAAYYRRVKRSLENALSGQLVGEPYPDPTEYCDVCRWRLRCDERRREDDHLCLVAGISKVQINELQAHHVGTMAQLAELPLPMPWKPERGAPQSYGRIREQARIQLEGRTAGQLLYELLPLSPECGLSKLPSPSEGDIFFDLEGDPFVGEGGLEYLFGYAVIGSGGGQKYFSDWAFSRQDEKRVFEQFIDFVMDRWGRWPDLHIYHYAPYEPAALKRLMGRYATREDEIDRLLRAGIFVDLYAIVRHGLRASVETYSIKKLEPLYEFTRAIHLPQANHALAKLQACLELGDVQTINEEDRRIVEGYNRDDCLSTGQLRNWLENQRAELVAIGTRIERPVPKAGDPSDGVTAWQVRITPIIERLTEGVPVDAEERTSEQHARWLLAHMLDWHRREQKATWWEFFRLADLMAEELLEERAALAGLTFLGSVGGTTRAPIQRYSFPPQETELRGGEDLHARGGSKLGAVNALSIEERWVEIKKRGDSIDVHPEAVFSHKVVGTEALAESLLRLGQYVAEHGISAVGPYQAARDMLLRQVPRLEGFSLGVENGKTLDIAIRIAGVFRQGVLPIQGPPGAGKTFTGARMICALVKDGRTVGITANSHKVIRNLLDEVLKAADEIGLDLNCVQKPGEPETDMPRLKFTKDNAATFAAIGRTGQVIGGTGWLWACPEAFEAVDVLFVDEAAQMSLANVLAVAQAAKAVVLLGDPQQLDQPMKGTHPEGTDVSALHHLLAGQQTIQSDQGLFLEETWRLHPRICDFTSELFYEGRLRPHSGLELQEVRSECPIHGSGLFFVPIRHEGNQNSSPEEADRVKELVQEILASNATWVDREGIERPLKMDDILIIAPYNAQVFELKERVPNARIGTVDKFQGQEAPIVIYSMTTSTQADAPRGMEFLYSLNRLNVATSRAKCICILVASPAVLEADCRTPRQMQLANAFCRYLELGSLL